MTQISSIHTPCKKCVFAKYENITQTDCSLGYLDIFKNKSHDIVEAFDEEKEFYVINGKKCIGYRENKWFEQFGLEHASLQDKINKYNELNSIDYAIVIDLKSLTFPGFEHICDQITACSIKPNKIVIVRYPDEDKIFSYIKIDSLLKTKNINCTWRITTMVDTSLSSNDILDGIVSHNITNRFIVSITNVNNDLHKVVTKANDIVYKDFDQFIVLGNEEKTCFIFSAAVFRYGKILGEFILLNHSEYTVI